MTAGDKVVVNPLLTTIPCIDQPSDSIEQEIHDLYSSSADIDLTDTF